jgi:hypothetical protein
MPMVLSSPAHWMSRSDAGDVSLHKRIFLNMIGSPLKMDYVTAAGIPQKRKLMPNSRTMYALCPMACTVFSGFFEKSMPLLQ